MTETEQLLSNKYDATTLSIRQIAVELHRLGKNGKPADKSILNDISAGTFPIRTYKLGKRRVADIRDVAAYLDMKRQEGQEQEEAA